MLNIHIIAEYIIIEPYKRWETVRGVSLTFISSDFEQAEQ